MGKTIPSTCKAIMQAVAKSHPRKIIGAKELEYYIKTIAGADERTVLRYSVALADLGYIVLTKNNPKRYRFTVDPEKEPLRTAIPRK